MAADFVVVANSESDAAPETAAYIAAAAEASADAEILEAATAVEEVAVLETQRCTLVLDPALAKH